MKVKDWADGLETVLKLAGVKGFLRDFRFAPPRRWKFDLARPDLMIAVECEGCHWANGRHTRGGGYEKDIEKYNAASLGGWLLVRCTGRMVQDGSALALVERALASRRGPSQTVPVG